MHKDMGGKNKWDKHSVPEQKQSNNTGPSTLTDSILDCRHTLFFQFLLLLPSPTGSIVTKSMKQSAKKPPKNKTYLLKVGTSYFSFQECNQKVSLLSNMILFIQKKQLPFGSSVKLGCFEPTTNKRISVKRESYNIWNVLFWVHNTQM